jgi:hypothetical protein
VHVVVAAEQSVAFGAGSRLLDWLFDALSKKFSQDAACRPDVDLLAVVNVAVEEFGAAVVPSGDVSDGAAGWRLVSLG